MATQAIRIALIAGDTSAKSVTELIQGCQLNDIGGVCIVRDINYEAQIILEKLHEAGLDVQLPSYEQTGKALLNILMYVPDEQRERVDAWYEKHFNRIDRWDWGVQIGDKVLSPPPEKTDSFQHQFTGTVLGFRCAFAQVEDMQGDVFDIEPFRLAYMPRNGEAGYLDTIRKLVEQELPELSERYWARHDAKENSSTSE